LQASSILKLHTGYTSDHRALLVDFDPVILFGKATANIPRSPRLKLVSTNPRTMAKYIQHIKKSFQSNQVVERVQALAQTMADDKQATMARIEEFHRLDAQITMIYLQQRKRARKIQEEHTPGHQHIKKHNYLSDIGPSDSVSIGPVETTPMNWPNCAQHYTSAQKCNNKTSTRHS
jgi:TusA-related sulfurtransferase